MRIISQWILGAHYGGIRDTLREAAMPHIYLLVKLAAYFCNIQIIYLSVISVLVLLFHRFLLLFCLILIARYTNLHVIPFSTPTYTIHTETG